MENATTKELFFAIQAKLIISLEENEIICPTCKGLRFTLVERKDKSYVEHCRACHTGKLYVCKHCGEGTKSNHCTCKEANKERDITRSIEQFKKETDAFHKAEKIDYKEYDGYFLLPTSERLKTIEDVSDWITDKLAQGEETPEYLWAVEGEPHLSIDLKDVISEKCEDGYEDMYDHLDADSQLLSQAQELIDQWQEEQGDSLSVFTETYKKAVIIKGLVDDIRKEMDK